MFITATIRKLIGSFVVCLAATRFSGKHDRKVGVVKELFCVFCVHNNKNPPSQYPASAPEAYHPGNSERGQTESVVDSAHSVETGGKKGCERVSDSETTSPASIDSSGSAEVVSLIGSAGGEHASEVSDRTGVDESVGGVAGDDDDKRLAQQLTQLVQTQAAMVAAQTRAVCSKSPTTKRLQW